MKKFMTIILNILAAALLTMCQDYYNDAKDKVVADSSKIYQDRYLASKNIISSLESDTSSLHQRIDELQKNANKNRHTIDSLRGVLEGKEQKIREEKAKVKSYTDNLQILLSELDEYEDTTSKKDVREKVIVETIDKLYKLMGQKTPETIQDRIRSLSDGCYYTDTEIESIKQNIIDSMNQEIADTISTITTIHEEEIDLMNGKHNKEIKEKDKIIRNLTVQINKRDSIIKTLNKTVNNLTIKLGKKDEEISNLNEQIRILNNQNEEDKKERYELFINNMVRNVIMWTDTERRLKRVKAVKLTFNLPDDMSLYKSSSLLLYFRITDKNDPKGPLMFSANEEDWIIYENQDLGYSWSQKFDIKDDDNNYETNVISIDKQYRDLNIAEYQIDVYAEIDGEIKKVGDYVGNLKKSFKAKKNK